MGSTQDVSSIVRNHYPQNPEQSNWYLMRSLIQHSQLFPGLFYSVGKDFLQHQIQLQCKTRDRPTNSINTDYYCIRSLCCVLIKRSFRIISIKIQIHKRLISEYKSIGYINKEQSTISVGHIGGAEHREFQEQGRCMTSEK